MSSDAMDYYDVQAAIRDARSEIRGDIHNAVSEEAAARRAAVDELREEVAALHRALDARTEHLA